MSVQHRPSPLLSGLDRSSRRPPAPLRRIARLLFVVGLAVGACWLIPEGAPMGQAGTSLRGALGPTGWLVPLWVLVLALRCDRRARRCKRPVVTRHLLGAGALSLAALLAPSTAPALPAGMAALGSGLLLAGLPWRRLRPALCVGARVLWVAVVLWRRTLRATVRMRFVAVVLLVGARRVLVRILVATASLFVQVLGTTARILIDPFVLPPIVASDVPLESHRRALLLSRRRLRMPARPRRRRGDSPPASHPDDRHAPHEGTPAEGA